MAISAALLKFYKSLTWTEGDTHGGAIDTTGEIASGISQNIFDNISDAERISGVTDYRKIHFRNENTDGYNNVKAWIDTNTPATNTDISILAAGSKSVQNQDSAALSGTFTFAASATVIASVDVSKEVRPGEKIFNSTNDTNTAAVKVISVSADGLTITLASAYAGTTGSGKAAKLAPITACTFLQPTSKADVNVLDLGSLGQNQSNAIWIKRTVSAGGDGYTDDTFTLKVENS